MKKRIIIGFVLIILVQVISINAKDCGGNIKCECGDTLISSQVMDYDILNCSTIGLTIGSNNVILDCAGHSIQGKGYSNFGEITNFGIYLEYSTNVLIKNCNVTKFWYGINLEGYHAGEGGSHNTTIFNNTVSDNGGKGIVVYTGIVNISNNKVFSNQIGIESSFGGNSIIYNNYIFNNSASGIARTIEFFNFSNIITYNNIYDNGIGLNYDILYYRDTFYNPIDVLIFNNIVNKNYNLVYYNNQDPSFIFLVKDNWWGSNNKSEISKKMYNTLSNLSFIPFLCEPYPSNKLSDENGNCVFDQDNDGVPNNQDKCPNTIEQQIVYGCNCKQILAFKPGNNKGELKNGCSNGTVDIFTKQIGWAKNLFSQ